jgi:uncharacterized protein
MLHLAVPRAELQARVPFELDLLDGRAFVSLVLFTMRDIGLARGPRWLNWMFYPFREQHFLNVRTYVRCRGEPGIHFISEWISSRVCTPLGPPLYALPYRFGKHVRQSDRGRFDSCVSDWSTGTKFSCHMAAGPNYQRCAEGTLDHFLLERYAAFNQHHGRAKSFRVWHSPWEQAGADAMIREDSLLRKFFGWYASAELVGANTSPGTRNVLMGAPQRITPVL